MGNESSDLVMLILSNILDIKVDISSRQLDLEFREAVKAEDIYLGIVNKYIYDFKTMTLDNTHKGVSRIYAM